MRVVAARIVAIAAVVVMCSASAGAVGVPSAGAGTMHINYSPALGAASTATTVTVVATNTVRGEFQSPTAATPALGSLIFGWGDGLVLSGTQSSSGGWATGQGYVGMCTQFGGLCWNAYGTATFTRTQASIKLVYEGKYLANGKRLAFTLTGRQISRSGTTKYVAAVY
jgi:hypothetical protein